MLQGWELEGTGRLEKGHVGLGALGVAALGDRRQRRRRRELLGEIADLYGIGGDDREGDGVW